MDDDVRVDYGYLRLTRYIVSAFPWLKRYSEFYYKRLLSPDHSTCVRIVGYFLSFFVNVPLVLALVFLMPLFILFIFAFYFMLTVYMDSVFVLFTVLIAYYGVPKRVFYGYLSSVIGGLFITWLNCDPAHFSKLVAMQLLCNLKLKPLVRLLDAFGKFRSSCPIDGLSRAVDKVMIFRRTSLLIEEIDSRSLLEKDKPHNFFGEEGRFKIVCTSETATVLFRTKFHYFMKEFDWDENRLGVVSRAFRLMFEERIPVGSFVGALDAGGVWFFHHMSPTAIINKVMSGEEIQICKLADTVDLYVV